MNTHDKLYKETTDRHIQRAEARIDSKLIALREMGYRQDAIAFTKSQLEDLESTIYDVLYANPQDAFVFLPINSSVSAGATSYSYRMVSKIGAAKITADGAQDSPIVDLDLAKTSQDIYQAQVGYTYTVGDQDRGGILDFDYVQDKARLASQTIALAHNEYAFLGGSGVDGGYASILGFLNNTSVNIGKASGGDYVITDDDWTGITGANAYATVTDMIHQVITQSSGLHKATDVGLSTFVWNACAKLLLNSTTSQSVLSALRQNYPDITFHMTASGTARGAGGIDRCFAYQKSSDMVEYVAPVIYQESTPDKAGFAYTVQARGRMAGTITRYPLSQVYADITVA